MSSELPERWRMMVGDVEQRVAQRGDDVVGDVHADRVDRAVELQAGLEP